MPHSLNRTRHAKRRNHITLFRYVFAVLLSYTPGIVILRLPCGRPYVLDTLRILEHLGRFLCPSSALLGQETAVRIRAQRPPGCLRKEEEDVDGCKDAEHAENKVLE